MRGDLAMARERKYHHEDISRRGFLGGAARLAWSRTVEFFKQHLAR